jgi:hypothetical protein
MQKLDQFHQIQEVDKEIYRHARTLRSIPQEIEKLKGELETEKSTLRSLEQESKNFQVQQKKKETDLAAKEENIRKYEAQLNSVKTNKEYTALQHEINNLKADNQMLEEEILKIMEQGETYKTKIAEEKKRLVQHEAEFQNREKALLDEKKKVENEIAELKTKKIELSKGADPEILSLYERILVKKEGIALVPVVNGACSSCSMQLRPQLLDQVHMKDRVVVCENCSRILFISE